MTLRLWRWEGDCFVDGPSQAQQLRALEETARFVLPPFPDREEGGSALIFIHRDRSQLALTHCPDGRLILDGIGEPTLERHLLGIESRHAFKLWVMLAEARFEEIRSLPWLEGPGWAETDGFLERERLAEVAQLLEYDRSNYDAGGEERTNVACRKASCRRGAVAHSVMCRPHHYEMVYGKPSPFDH